jgi:hypothetical protein
MRVYKGHDRLDEGKLDLFYHRSTSPGKSTVTLTIKSGKPWRDQYCVRMSLEEFRKVASHVIERMR